MKNLWKILSESLLMAVLALLPATVRAEANPDELAELTWIQMLNSVDPGKGADLIRKFQDKEARTVLLKSIYGEKNNGCRVENIRNKEVLLVTIPAENLFGPNSRTLREDADKYLEPIKRYLKQPDMWRVMLVMNTDNTGSPQYREELTEDRVLAVTDWFEEQPKLDTDFLFPYSLSDTRPLIDTPNNTMENRNANRRLEIYLVPGETMVDMAKKGKIAF